MLQKFSPYFATNRKGKGRRVEREGDVRDIAR
jgi:hypothetical protein